jgi:hypothetical protein
VILVLQKILENLVHPVIPEHQKILENLVDLVTPEHH